MTDPVAEAAAQIALQEGQAAEPNGAAGALLAGLHNLEAKVEHLIHPETEAPTVEAPGEALPSGTPADSGTSLGSSGPVSTETEPGNVVAAAVDGGPVAGAVVADGGDLPNAASAVAESTTVTASATPASGSGETLSIAASSGEGPNAGGTTATATVDSAVTGTPTLNSASRRDQLSQTLGAASQPSAVKPAHLRIAQHLEAIYTIATEAPVTAVADTSYLKTHVGDILHRISNGMQVTEGELVQKLEALYRML